MRPARSLIITALKAAGAKPGLNVQALARPLLDRVLVNSNQTSIDFGDKSIGQETACTQLVSTHRILLIVNPGSCNAKTTPESLAALLDDHGLHVHRQVRATGPEVGDVIRQHASFVDLVVLAGGDGTINAAAKALLETGLPLGLLPIGTANDLARTLAIPQDVQQAAAVIANGYIDQIDLCQVGDSYFLNAANIGLGVQSRHYLTDALKSRWGVLAYLVASLKAIHQIRPFRAQLVSDETTLKVRSIQITVANGRHYGGGMTVDREATLDDSCLHVFSLRPQSLWRLALLSPALRLGYLARRKGVTMIQSGWVEIQTSRSLRLIADGEFIGRTPARFEVIPRALSVYLPSASPPFLQALTVSSL